MRGRRALWRAHRVGGVRRCHAGARDARGIHRGRHRFLSCSTVATPIAASEPHREATWRFAVVAGVGFLLTAALMHGLVTLLGMPYLVAQALTTGVVLSWSFLAHRMWTFSGPPIP